MTTETLAAPATTAPPAGMEGMSQLHDQLREIYSETTNGVTDEHTQGLMAYNGYYQLTGEGAGTGAFFTVDTNMIITNGGAPVYHISLIISLNGTQSHIFQFTGSSASFDKETSTLTWKQPQGSTIYAPDINITFKRVNDGVSPLMSFTGSIILPGNPHFNGKGTSYNNIIPVTTYEGTYYDVKAAGSPKVMEILPDCGLKYLNLMESGEPTTVDSYIYNMNMYFFSFMRGDFNIKIIMGTSSGGGMVCNDFTTYNEKGATPLPRPLQTILKTTKMEPKLNARSEELMQYSGFYRIQSTTANALKPGAFVSIEGSYTIKPAGTEYKIELGVSTDGISSKLYVIDTNMTFDGETLTIPAENYNTGDITIKFKREYVAHGNYGSLVTISGTIGDTAFTGSTPLNPVPLTAFGGATMKSRDGLEKLSIPSDTEVIYNGNPQTELLYVPVMYIIAFPSEAPGQEVIVSLGTDGGRGNTAIITDPFMKKDNKLIDVTYAIPFGHSGQNTPPQN